jgi:hypothetical protein
MKPMVLGRTFGLALSFLFSWTLAAQSAGTLAGSYSPIATGSNVDLTMAGKLDWVHWGLTTDGSIDRKASVTPRISSFKLLGDAGCATCFLGVYQYSDNANGYTWHDGTPNAAVTNTTTGIWAYNYPIPIGSGFQLQVPADTSPKTLQVFVGAYAGRGQLTASLSDNSAPGFTSSVLNTVNNIGNGPGGVFTLNFAAASAGQTLTVNWELAQTAGNGNVTLQAAALTAAGADNPPYVVLTAPTNAASLAEPAAVQLQAAAQDFDGTVTNVSFYQGTSKLGQATSAPYTATWPGVTRGRYVLTATTTDNAGTTSTSAPVELFVYGTGGAQTNQAGASVPWVDLTTEGTADWTHWGNTNGPIFDYKALVPRKISDLSLIGTNPPQTYTDNYTTFSWSDGTVTGVMPGTSNGVYVAGMGNGFKVTAPADTSLRELRIYVGGYSFAGSFEAYLSDFSAPPFVDFPAASVYQSGYTTYTIDYRAASAGQQLVVLYRAQSVSDPLYGNVTLQAATLQGGPADPLPVQVQNIQAGGGQVTFSFLSQSGFNYTVWYTDSLSPVQWKTLEALPGTGGMLTATDSAPATVTRFYRIQTQ